MPVVVGKYIDAGRLLVTRILDTGAYGAVCAVEDVGTGATYAVKCLLPRAKTSAGIPASTAHLFKHEVDMHAAIPRHANVVTLHRHFSENGLHFLVFDLHADGDLHAGIRDSGLFWRRDERVKDAFLQIVDGVAHCHAAGVAHRDIKPANILIGADGDSFALGDFGLATNKAKMVARGVGTKQYKAPESITTRHLAPCDACATSGVTCRHYDPRAADVWSLGIVLVAMITGRAPWDIAHPSDARYTAFLADPSSLLAHLPLSRDILPFLMRLLAIDPAARIAPADIRTELARVAHLHPTDAELTAAPDTVREAATKRAQALGCAHELPTPARWRPATPAPLSTPVDVPPQAQAPARAPSSAGSDFDPTEPQFAFSLCMHAAAPEDRVRRAVPYMPFMLDDTIVCNTARRRSLPRLAIAS